MGQSHKTQAGQTLAVDGVLVTEDLRSIRRPALLVVRTMGVVCTRRGTVGRQKI